MVVQLVGEVAQHHVVGLTQPETRLDMDAARTTPSPQHHTRAATRQAPAPLIHQVITKQQVQHDAGPALDRAGPAAIKGSRLHSVAQVAAQRLAHEVMGGLLHAQVHAGGSPGVVHAVASPLALLTEVS
jgi:hypothetical protein